MKKLIYLSMAALVLLAVSCKKDNSGSNADDGKVPVPEAVDIGLVVNGKTIKWASFNLGASKEYEYGNFYAWGETKPKPLPSSVSRRPFCYSNVKRVQVTDKIVLVCRLCI